MAFYTVTKRNGEVVNFSTELTIDQAAEILGNRPLTEVTGSFMNYYRAGRLSENQRLWMLKLAQDAKFPPMGPYLPIVEALHGFRERGKLTGEVTLKLAHAILKTVIKGQNVGALYVYTAGREYVGKITPGGALVWKGEDREDVLESIEHANRDPVEAARAYGRETGHCACCKRKLTDPISVWAAIGPVCLERLAGPEARKQAEREYRLAQAA